MVADRFHNRLEGDEPFLVAASEKGNGPCRFNARAEFGYEARLPYASFAMDQGKSCAPVPNVFVLGSQVRKL